MCTTIKYFIKITSLLKLSSVSASKTTNLNLHKEMHEDLIQYYLEAFVFHLLMSATEYQCLNLCLFCERGRFGLHFIPTCRMYVVKQCACIGGRRLGKVMERIWNLRCYPSFVIPSSVDLEERGKQSLDTKGVSKG